MSCTNTTRNSPIGKYLNDRGSAIVLVVSMGALVTLMVFTWVAFSVGRYHVIIDKRDGLNARYAAESAVSKAIYGQMVNPSDTIRRDSMVIVSRADSLRTRDTMPAVDTFLNYTDTVHHSQASASVGEEGSFLRVKANGTAGNVACEIDALFGYKLPPQFRYALILAEQNRRLEIRKGHIIGDVQLAQQPQGSIEGKVDVGTAAGLPQVNSGKFESDIKGFESKMQLPENAETVLQSSQVYNEHSPPPFDSGKDLFVNGNILIENTSNSPFIIKGPGTIISSGSIQISGNTVMENVEILALDKITIFDNARLRDVTIFSMTTIGLGDEVRYTGNLYAFKNITLAGSAVVAMPSFAYVRGLLTDSLSGIWLTQESNFSGTVFCDQGARYSVIAQEARFSGLFYTKGDLVLEGTVFGCVAAASLRDPNDRRKNSLAGGTINRKMLPNNFIVPCAFGQKGVSDAFALVSWSEQLTTGKTKRN
jgi:cytoskeletal protein CcmA (bactofilin family)